jgi:dipeptidyl aminopeptidase/acylaminoacyl peptidase
MLSLAILASLVPVSPEALDAQQPYSPSSVTADEYARAQGFLGTAMNPLVYGTGVRPNWLEGGRFWYRNRFPAGNEFIMVDPSGWTRERAFDHERLAGALSEAAGETFSPFDLPFSTFHLNADGRSISFDAGVRTYECDIRGYECTWEPRRVARSPASQQDPRARAMAPEVLSPDGMKAAFIRDHNLWMRDTRSEDEAQLTTDGVEDFGYATNNAGWTKSDRPVLLWSPDSKKLATFQHDGRGVGMMYLVSTGVGHPELEAWKYPLPEDSVIFRIHRVVIDVENPSSPQVVRLDMPPDQHRSTICDHIYCNGAFSDVEWAPDGSQLAFVSSSRDHKEAQLRVADPETGAVRDVLFEREETYFESGEDMVNWHFFPEYDEVVWFSERSDWGHLYLYDLTTGELKHPITSGDWRVLQLHHVDRDGRMLYFTGSGKEPGDPYFQYLYSVSMDGGEVRLLTPDSANHDITFSPNHDYFVDSYSTPLDPGATVVRDMRGAERMALERGDISELEAAGWQPPVPFSVKARDGTTDLYGIMFKPSHLDPTKKYPVVNYLYPGPQSGSVGSRSFSAARREHQAMAELGFVVVTVDAMGTPGRSKSFHDAYYGNMGDNGLPDQIAAIKGLAARNPWMDLDRVGIWGGSGGGFASTAGILRYPDFYKVAVSTSGNHDNRNYEDDWGEKWQGLLETYADGTTNYDNQANQLVAGNLKGKLFLAHGSMDSNVPPNNTMVVVDALISANKDFDLLLLPNRGHGLGEPYMVRRRWDYFVTHLLGAEAPKEFPMGGR